MAPSAAARAPMRAHPIHTPNDALQRDAGALAGAVARVFARPHAAYFEADPGRRRMIAYLAHGLRLSPKDADALAGWSMRRLAAHYAPDAPDGFVEAVKRAQGVWTAGDYATLAELLREGGEVLKTLRHLPALDRTQLAVLAALPPALRRGKIVALLGAAYYADLLARTVRHAWGRTPAPALLRSVAERLERASSTQALFAWLVEDVGVGRITPPPIPGADWLRPIIDVRDIERTALKFKNCLRTRAPMMLRGQAAYFEVLGDEPAVVEVTVGKGGDWMIGEIRGHANGDVSAQLMQQILLYLARFGAIKSGPPPQLALELAAAAGW